MGPGYRNGLALNKLPFEVAGDGTTLAEIRIWSVEAIEGRTKASVEAIEGRTKAMVDLLVEANKLPGDGKI